MKHRVRWVLGLVAVLAALNFPIMPAAQAVSVPPALVYATNTPR